MSLGSYSPPGGGSPRGAQRGTRGGQHHGKAPLAVVCAVLFLTFLDNTVVSVTLADIQSSLHAGVSDLQWIVDGFMLTFAVLMLTGGTLGDLLGRKKVMLSGVAVFSAGSVIALVAPDAGVLIAGRVVMGVGAAASEPGTLSMIRHLYPDRGARARAIGAWAAVSGAALSFGPIIGGAIIGVSSWREVFAFNLGFGVIAIALGALLLPENSDPESAHFDVPGLAAGAVTVAAATVSIIEGEAVGYTTWWIDLLFALALVSAVVFIVIERRTEHPVLPTRFFANRTFTTANVVAFTTNFAVFAVFFFTTLYLQLIASLSGYQIALQFLTMAAAMVLVAPATGWWVSRHGPRWPTTVGCLLAGGGLIAVDQVLSPNVTAVDLAWTLALVGLGFGMTLVTMTSSMLTVVAPERSGMAASTVNTSRELGGVIGVAVLGSIVNGQLTAHLAARLHQLGIPPNFESIVIEAVTHGRVGGSSVASAAHNHPHIVAHLIAAAENAFGAGLNIALLVAAALMLASVPLALALPRGTLRQAGDDTR